MTVPVIAEKLGVPPLPASYLARPRLERLPHERWAGKRLVLVTAGGGYGKTSFLSAAAHAFAGHSLWYSLDDLDTALPTFCAHLHALVMPEGTPPPDGGTGDPESVQRLLYELTTELREPERPRWIVLDDAHRLNDAPEVLALLERFQRYLPDGNLLILAGREPVGLAVAKRRSYGEAISLTAADLAFRTAEVEQLLALRFPGAAIDPALVKRVRALTEGWPAGLEILLQALPDGRPESLSALLGRLRRAGAGWFEYFAEEVVDHLDGETRTFLEQTAILPRLDPGLCDELLAAQDSAARLESLARRNLFTFPAGEGDGAYRYHQLFRSYLRRRLERSWPATRLRRWQQQVARALATRGAAAEAASLFVRGGDPDAALGLIERVGEQIIAAGQHVLVRRIFAALPESRIAARPRALFIQGRLLDVQGEWEAAEAIYRQALRRAPSAARRVEILSLLAQLVSRRAAYGEAKRLCRRALAERARMSTRTRGRLLSTLGVADAELGQVAAGERNLERARLLFRRNGDRAGEARADYLLAANVHLPRGDFAAAKEATRRALAVFRQLRIPRRACVSLTVLAWTLLRGGEPAAARRAAEQGRQLAERLGQRSQAAFCRCLLGWCDLLAGQREAAHAHLTAALAVGDALRESDIETLPRLGLVEWCLAGDDAQAARRHARDALALARANRDPLQETQAQLALARVSAALGMRSARSWRAKAVATARRIGAAFEGHHGRLLQLAADDLPAERAPAALGTLIAGIAERGHEHIILQLEPEAGGRLLARALGQGLARERVKRLLIQLGPRAVAPLAPLLKRGAPAVRADVIDVLAQIGGDEARRLLAELLHDGAGRDPAAAQAARELARLPREALRIRALGPLRIQIGSRSLTRSDWRSRRALRAFELLLTHRFRWVARDQVLEALWPDETLEKATNNLWQTIHQLRRTLEPDLKGARESCYVRYQNEAYRLVPGDACRYDVFEFEEAIRRGDALWNSRRRPRAERHYLEALSHFRGDYLEESPYEEYAVAEREHVREQLTQLLQRLLSLYATRRSWPELLPLCRRGLAHDPYQENFHYHLVEAHLRLGHRRDALDAYHRYEAQLVKEMGLPPTSRMRSLAAQVVAPGLDAAVE